MLIEFIILQFSFLVVLLSAIGIRVMLASKNELESIPSSPNFWKSLKKVGRIHFFNLASNLTSLNMW